MNPKHRVEEKEIGIRGTALFGLVCAITIVWLRIVAYYLCDPCPRSRLRSPLSRSLSIRFNQVTIQRCTVALELSLEQIWHGCLFWWCYVFLVAIRILFFSKITAQEQIPSPPLPRT